MVIICLPIKIPTKAFQVVLRMFLEVNVHSLFLTVSVFLGCDFTVKKLYLCIDFRFLIWQTGAHFLVKFISWQSLRCRSHQCLFPMTVPFLDYCTQLLIITHNWHVHFVLELISFLQSCSCLAAGTWRWHLLTNLLTRPRYFVSLSVIRPNNHCVISEFDTENMRWIHPNEE